MTCQLLPFPSLALAAGCIQAKPWECLAIQILTAAKQSLRGVKFFSGYDATPREAKAQDLITRAEFDSVFTGGTILQPTPQNKPNSQVRLLLRSIDLRVD